MQVSPYGKMHRKIVSSGPVNLNDYKGYIENLSVVASNYCTTGGVNQYKSAVKTRDGGRVSIHRFHDQEIFYIEPSGKETYLIFLHHSDKPWEFMLFSISGSAGDYTIERIIPSDDVLKGKDEYPEANPVREINIMSFKDIPSPNDRKSPRDESPAVIPVDRYLTHYVGTVAYDLYHSFPYLFRWTLRSDETTKDWEDNILDAPPPLTYAPQHATTTGMMYSPPDINSTIRSIKNELAKYGTIHCPTPIVYKAGETEYVNTSILENRGWYISHARNPYTMATDKPYAKTFQENIVKGNPQTVVEVCQSNVKRQKTEIFRPNFLFPWIPYLHETPSFMLQDIGYSEREGTVTNQEVREPYSYHIDYGNTKDDLKGYENLTVKDFLAENQSFNVQETYTINTTTDKRTEDGRVVCDRQETWNLSIPMSSSMKLYQPICALGIDKALFIENNISISGNASTSEVANWHYDYSEGFDFYWGLGCTVVEPFLCQDGTYDMNYSADITLTSQKNRSMSITQKLMLGDLEIESVDSSFEYTFGLTSENKAEGGTIWSRLGPLHDPCEGSSIGYTSLNMQIGTNQSITGSSTYGKAVTWTLSGGGSLSSLSGSPVTYYAPANNPGCIYKPVISLYMDGVFCKSIALGVYATGLFHAAYFENVLFFGSPCSYNILMKPVRCDGTAQLQQSYWLHLGGSAGNASNGTCPQCWVAGPAGYPQCTNNGWTWRYSGVASAARAYHEEDPATDSLACDHSPSLYCPNGVQSWPYGPVVDNIACVCTDGYIQDVRTAAYITAGCCPAGLM